MNDFMQLIEDGVDPTPFLEDLIFTDRQDFINFAKNKGMDMDSKIPYLSMVLYKQTDLEPLEMIYTEYGIDPQYIELLLAIAKIRTEN